MLDAAARIARSPTQFPRKLLLRRRCWIKCRPLSTERRSAGFSRLATMSAALSSTRWWDPPLALSQIALENKIIGIKKPEVGREIFVLYVEISWLVLLYYRYKFMKIRIFNKKKHLFKKRIVLGLQIRVELYQRRLLVLSPESCTIRRTT